MHDVDLDDILMGKNPDGTGILQTPQNGSSASNSMKACTTDKGNVHVYVTCEYYQRFG